MARILFGKILLQYDRYVIANIYLNILFSLFKSFTFTLYSVRSVLLIMDCGSMKFMENTIFFIAPFFENVLTIRQQRRRVLERPTAQMLQSVNRVNNAQTFPPLE